MVVIESTAKLEAVCKAALVTWYKRNYQGVNITASDIFTVWLSKTLQNSKCILASNKNDGILAEYTYNGNDKELYEDVYKKLTNRVITE